MDPSSFETLKLQQDGGVAEITLSRPKALNALNEKLLGELEAALDALAKDASLRCVVLTGEGEKAFVAGADIAEMSAMTPLEAEAFAALGHRVFRKIEELPVPVLAAVNGFALGGGCELVLACDVAWASERAKFGQPEVKLGLIPGFGGSVRLARKVGMGAAGEWIYTGEMYDAQQAKALGLVRDVFAPADLLPKVRAVAQTIAKRAPVAVRAAKRVLVGGVGTDLVTALALERASFGSLFASEDVREGTKAFLEKREPRFQGR